MPEGTVDVEVDVAQIVDGLEYKGSVRFDTCRFQYKIKFGVPLPYLSQMAKSDEGESVLKCIKFSVTDSKNKPVSMDTLVTYIFLQTAGELVLEFYRSQQTRDMNKPDWLQAADYAHLSSEDLSTLCKLLGCGWGFVMRSSYKIQKTPEIEKFLAFYRK